MSTHAAPAGAVYELFAGTYTNGELRVLSFEGHEEINGLYAFDVRFWAADVDVLSGSHVPIEYGSRRRTGASTVSAASARTARGRVSPRDRTAPRGGACTRGAKAPY